MSCGKQVQQKMTFETERSSAMTLGRHSTIALAVFCYIWLLGSGRGNVAMEGSRYAMLSNSFPLGIFGLCHY